jgi:hypothetical protein
MTPMKKPAFAIIVLGLCSFAVAGEAPGGVPTTSADPIWAGVMVFIVIGLFVAAAAIGPLVAILMPTAEEPVSHDEHELDERADHGRH